MEKQVFLRMVAVAKQRLEQNVSYTFTPRELAVLERFFTNCDKKVFFVRFLPPAVSTTLLSMYSRIKNVRGIRGHLVDKLLPLILANFLPEFAEADVKAIQDFIDSNKLKNLDAFVEHSAETLQTYMDFLEETRINPKYMQRIASSPKIQQFLKLFLDQYGHNSIARMGSVVFCVENVSILTAKSLEWNRPASGFIELSTRFVDMQKTELYPIWEEIATFNEKVADSVKGECEKLFSMYVESMNDGVFQNHLREVYQKELAGLSAKEAEGAIFGETCDVMGNFLPAAALTSLGVAVSGEAFPELIKHLYLDKSPENFALAEFIIEESGKTGENQFLKHLEVSEWQKTWWEYLNFAKFYNIGNGGIPIILEGPSEQEFDRIINKSFGYYSEYHDVMLGKMHAISRTNYDKLPSQFELLSVFAAGTMTFRGWRDLHRQTFATHFRTYLTPQLGFYQYDKPAPEVFFNRCKEIHGSNIKMFNLLNAHRIPAHVAEYPMALGNLIGFLIGFNLKEAEFCTWQRTKFSVNHEVRQVFLAIENALQEKYSLWGDISRADMQPAYAFARTKTGIPIGPTITE